MMQGMEHRIYNFNVNNGILGWNIFFVKICKILRSSVQMKTALTYIQHCPSLDLNSFVIVNLKKNRIPLDRIQQNHPRYYTFIYVDISLRSEGVMNIKIFLMMPFKNSSRFFFGPDTHDFLYFILPISFIIILVVSNWISHRLNEYHLPVNWNIIIGRCWIYYKCLFVISF